MNSDQRTENRLHPWHHRVLGVGLRGVIWILRVLPPWAAYGIADVLVPVLVVKTFATKQISTRKKRGFYRNTAIVFRGSLSPAQRRRLLWRWARHMTHMCVDTCRMPTITRDNMAAFCDLEDMARMREQHSKGNAVLGTSGHVGTYEYTAHLIALSGMPLITIFRESPIPIVTDIINEIRSRTSGQVMTRRDGAVREMLRAAKRGDVLGIVADVSSKESEVFAPFLGTQAATNNTVGVLHVKTGAPIVVLTTQRTARQRYKVHVWDIIEDEATGDRDRDLQTIANRINAALTRAITEYPEQWFWDSRRYRRRPEGEVRDADDLPPRVDARPAEAILRRLGPT